MNNLTVKAALLTVTLFLTFTASAQSTTCINHDDLAEIGQTYSQVEKFVGNKAEYCEQDLGSNWLNIISSLVTLKNTQPNEPKTDQADALTYKAISERNWWTYFTNRAKRFTVKKSCQKDVVAYVIPIWGDGKIHLCPPFFKQNVSSQASIMMHEVRHFDGHGHVTCTRGSGINNAGACDDEITRGGSYAVSVQTLVGLARSKETTKEERPFLESEALYMAFNKFNTLPQLKLTKSILLSNRSGEVYKWTPGGEATLINSLKEPALIYNSFNNITVYPLDASVDAYRIGQKLSTKIENPGLFAKHYNEESPSEREKYKNVSYFGVHGILKENSLITLCNNKDLSTDNLDSYGEFTRVISLSSDDLDSERSSMLLAKNGSLVSFKCVSNDSTRLNIENTDLRLSGDAKNIVESFGLAGDQYAVLKNGTLTTLYLDKSNFRIQTLEMPIENKDWVSATPISKAKVF